MITNNSYFVIFSTAYINIFSSKKAFATTVTATVAPVTVNAANNTENNKKTISSTNENISENPEVTKASNIVDTQTIQSEASNENTSKSVNNDEQKTYQHATSSASSTNVTKELPTNSSNTVAGIIAYTVPKQQLYPESSIIIKNTTGKPISEEQLCKYIREWIISGQMNCADICDASGTYWATPWLDKTPNSDLLQAFINTNTQSALSHNITAEQLVKTVQELDRITVNNVPFTLPQAKAIIIKMLQTDGYATPSQVSKIEFIHGQPSGYYVYTKFSGNYIYWVVLANSGYAHG